MMGRKECRKGTSRDKLYSMYEEFLSGMPSRFSVERFWRDFLLTDRLVFLGLDWRLFHWRGHHAERDVVE
jgi:hypothetical protein